MSDKTLTIAQILTRLTEQPPYIAALTGGLTPAQLRTRPGPDEWSANEVLAHLRACADVWGGYIRKILDQRAELLAVLKPLPPEAWNRAASVTMVGKVMDRTVLDYGERLVVHEQAHVYQIEQIVNTLRH